MSVWDGVDRSDFYHNLRTLCRKRKYQSSSQCSARLLPHLLDEAEDRESSVGLSAKVECQLADDFAFLASWSKLPRHVAAAAAQQKTEPCRTCIVVAANQGVNPRVRAAFEMILRVLERRARQELSKAETQRYCQTAVVSLHRDRIFGRLGPRKTLAKTQVPQRSPVDIGVRLASVVRQLQADSQGRRPEDKPAADTLIKQLNDVTQAITAAQAAPCGSADELAGLHRILESAFEVVQGDESLVPRLRRLGVQSVGEQSKEIRQIYGLATYRRICTYLAKVSGGQYREWFRSIELHVLEAPPQSHGQGHKAFVHAEIQLLLHFELHPKERPRFIGASKKPCFLCYCFIRAHATYSTRASHGEVYEKWTVPDREAFSAPSRTRLSTALRQTSLDVEQASKKANPKGIYLHPQQTVSKLLWNLSQSSAASDAAVKRQRPVVASSSRGAPSPGPVEISEVDTGVPSSDDLVSMRPSSSDADSEIDVVIAQAPSSVSPAEPAAPATISSSIISPRHALEFHSREMSLYVELEGSEDSEQDVDGTAKRFRRASCRVTHVEAGGSASILGVSEATDRVIVDDLLDGEVVVEREADSEALRVILEAGVHHHVLELVWLEV